MIRSLFTVSRAAAAATGTVGSTAVRAVAVHVAQLATASRFAGVGVPSASVMGKMPQRPGAFALQSRFLATRGSHIANHTSHKELIEFVKRGVSLCKPDAVHVCNGTEEEYAKLCDEMVAAGTLVRLNEEKRPNSFYARSDPSDVARVESRTFICSETPEQAGPTNNWMDPEECRSVLNEKFDGCMKGRTMYVVPFSMGPVGSPISKIGVQLTDSAYAAVSMRIMTRMGSPVLEALGDDGEFVPCMHSVGFPLELESGEKREDVAWPCEPKASNKYICHFPKEREIWSYGSGYGGNALLGKKCLALRIGSAIARDEGWLAEHMLLLGITNPQGEKKYMAAAFPSACGKTNLAMMLPSIPGWKVECVGDDIAWMKLNPDGRLYAINPEAGMFGVAPGTSMSSNPNAMKTLYGNSIFTNTALTDDGDVWWEKLSKTPPKNMKDWRGKPFTPLPADASKEAKDKHVASHPNARFTAPMSQCPVVDDYWEAESGVPISAIIFGGRRSDTMPLVMEANSWEHGVFLGATMKSEGTAAAENTKPEPRHDPFAMLPFCGYNMADYWAHWFKMEFRAPHPEKLPKIFHVNWFKKDAEGDFVWPGFGENSRVLKWIFERTQDLPHFMPSPVGNVPTPESLDTTELDVTPEQLDMLFKVDQGEWKEEIDANRHWLATEYGDACPPEMHAQLDALEERVNDFENRDTFTKGYSPLSPGGEESE